MAENSATWKRNLLCLYCALLFDLFETFPDGIEWIYNPSPMRKIDLLIINPVIYRVLHLNFQ